MYISYILLACITFACQYCSAVANTPPFTSDKLIDIPFKDKIRISPCNVCYNLAKSFSKALADTTRQSFAGGDTDWEEKKLGSYENSELRFIEIQERLCADATAGKDQCYNLAEEYEEDLETWFFKKRSKKIDLFTSLCIEKLQWCCPNNTYGPNCVPCPGGIEKPCGGHGKCVNGGTRQEPASCKCDSGYVGDLCDKCDVGYYQSTSTSPLFCVACDVSCKSHCRGPGPKNCEICSNGYQFLPDEGCVKNEVFEKEEEDDDDEDEEEEKDEDEKVTNNSKTELNPQDKSAINPSHHSEL